MQKDNLALAKINLWRKTKTNVNLIKKLVAVCYIMKHRKKVLIISRLLNINYGNFP